MKKLALLSLIPLAACSPRSDGAEAGLRIFELRRTYYAYEAARLCPNDVSLVRSDVFERDYKEFNAHAKKPGSILRESYDALMRDPAFCGRLRENITSSPATFPHLRLK